MISTPILRRRAAFTLGAIPAALLAVALTATALAQTTTTPAASGKKADEVLQLDTVVVSGYGASLAQSLEAKRAANAIVDVITAEDVGKFPDTNVAESLSHVPGVTVDRLFGQGERVSILGTDPNLNRTLLNGQTVASGDWFILDAPSRQFNYTLLAPEVIGQAEVYRTSEARLPEGSIGGTILLHTQHPLEGAPFAVSGTVGDMYNDRGKDHDFNFSGVVSWRNDRKTLGLLVGLQSAREHLRRDGVEALGTVSAGAAAPNTGIDPAAPAGSLNLTNPTALLPNAINAAYFLQQRNRTGGNAVLEFKPSEHFHVEVNALNVTVDNNNFNTSYYVFPGWWRGAVVNSGNVVNGIIDSGHINQNIGVMDLFYRKASTKTEAYDGKVTFSGDHFTLSAQAGYTKATGGTQAQYYIEPLLSTAGADVGSTGYSFSGAAANPSFTFDKAGVATNASAWTVGGPWWNGNIAADPEKDDEKYAQVDGAFQPAKGMVKTIKAGVRYTNHSTSQNWYNLSLTTLPFYTLANFGPSQTPGNYLDGLPNITSDMKNHVIINPDLLKDAVYGANSGTPGQTMQQALEAGAGFQPTQSFQVDEKTKAIYVQADFDFDKVKGNVGARYVQTDTTSAGYAVSGGITTPVKFDQSYNNFLPSANLAYQLRDDVVLRFGASSVIARPNYADMSSSVTLYDSIRQGVGGNPNLKPYKSVNLDAAFEYYFTKQSAVGLNLFYKDISNYILKANGTESYFNQNLGTITPYTISRPENAGDAKSQGFMVFYQQTLAHGFGVTANYAYVDASGNNGSELPYASKNQVNLSPYFENGKFLVRLTYAWRSEYFTNVDRGNNVYTDAYTELDANFAYNFTKNFSLTFACTNLLDETYYVYTKVPARMFQAEYKSGRRVQAGIHFKF
jgi:iron complex outermembrane receptor protein